MTEVTTPGPMRESVDLMRIGRAEIEANPDGIALSGPFMEALSISGLLSREAMLDTASQAFRQQVEALRPPFETAMAFLWISTGGNSRADQIAAGRDYVRINLAATGAGVALHPLSQALQEFIEMKPHFEAMRGATGAQAGETLQMFARLGYAAPPPSAPRWPYETRIRSA